MSLEQSFLEVCPIVDIPVGKSKRILMNGIPVAVFHTDQGFYAIEDACSHQGASLAFGSLDGNHVACPRHGAIFDIRNGEVCSLPALRGVRSYLTRVEAEVLFVATEPTTQEQPALLSF